MALLLPILGAALAGGVAGSLLVWLVLATGSPQSSERARIAVLDQRIAQQSDAIRDLAEEVNRLQHRIGMDRTNSSLSTSPAPEGEGDETLPPIHRDRENRFDGYADLMLLSARRRTNEGLRTIPQSRLVEIFGRPAAGLGQDCKPPTSSRLVQALVTRDVGPFRARLVKPAVESMSRIFAKLKADEPGLYRNLKTYGGLCARLIRGSSERISRHAFGMAIDVSVGGTIDAMGDGKTQFGLILLAEYFQEEGWLWGAAFGREDSMHFEISSDLFERWIAEGLI
ncbi:MAG: M15 family metallopeptidase [Paracoccaceae bacterium]